MDNAKLMRLNRLLKKAVLLNGDNEFKSLVQSVSEDFKEDIDKALASAKALKYEMYVGLYINSDQMPLKQVFSFKEARDVCMRHRDDNELGMRSWSGSKIYGADRKTPIGRVSYNGRVWDTNDKEIVL